MKAPSLLSLLLVITPPTLSIPITTNVLPSPTWQTIDYPIHSSCNATQTLQLHRALSEMILLASHAKSHILHHANTSTIYRKYFGNAPAAEPAGWYDRVINADRSEVLFRCDDPDRNCETQDGWAGHYRGANATQETVICPLSFTTRKPLEAICALGYTVASSPTNFYFASDLLHRIFHVPAISLGAVEHFAENYDEVLELAEEDSEKSVRDSDALQYFALEAFGVVVVGGKGCPGEKRETVPTSVRASKTAAATTTTEVGKPSITALTMKTESVKPSKTASARAACHTHSDGVVHCDQTS